MVSVIIPAYNAGRVVGRAIESALAQTLPPLEIVVVDDGSSDDTAAVAERYGAKVRVLRQANAGPAAARNRGARAAAGEWLAFLDSDDAWLPRKLERQLAHVGSPRVGLVCCLTNGSVSTDRITLESLWEYNYIGMSGVLVRRAAFDEVGGFDEDPGLISVEDYNLWLRIAMRWEIAMVPENLFAYLPETGSLSQQFERFALASIRNVDQIGRQLGIDPKVLAEKRLAILQGTARKAFSFRDLKAARRLYGRAFRQSPSFRSAAWWLATFAPQGLLEMRSSAFQVLKNDNA
ncbi:MAG TPA: glycosyltransferase family A protein [Bryobacteraceae bacterium]|nr:glycosyltransferase family A protein [Bryobacteraceae bacterium]